MRIHSTNCNNCP